MLSQTKLMNEALTDGNRFYSLKPAEQCLVVDAKGFLKIVPGNSGQHKCFIDSGSIF